MTTTWMNQGRRRGQSWALRLLWVSLIVLAALVYGQRAAGASQAPRATELEGLLPSRQDHHFFGLESIQPQGAVALTLTYAAVGLGADETVNFVVLDEVGLVRMMAGSDPLEVGIAVGSPLLFDPAGHRRTALAAGVQQAGTTVMVFSTAQQPVSYRLEVAGGLLRDDAGQSQTMELVDTAAPSAPSAALPQVTLVKQLPAAAPDELPAIVAPLKARRVTGELARRLDRHYLRLAPEAETGEVTLTLRYLAHSPSGGRDQLRFWVLTQDGIRQVAQGALIEELNLASGAPVLSLAGTTVLSARLRVASRVPYVVVVENQQPQPAGYILTVSGGLLFDDYGQTHEAQAAALESLVLAGPPR